jgi:hypothetical protein
MLLLEMLTIILGLAIAGSRAVCLVSPALSRRTMKGFLDRPLFVIVMGLVAALYGASLFYAARRAVWNLGDERIAFGLGVWAMIIGIVVCVAGLVILVKPALFMGMLAKVSAKSDLELRKFMATGLIFGLAILALGFIYVCR